MPYCTTCGSEVTDEMLFCHQCGRTLRISQGGLKVNNIHDPTAQVEAPANTSSPRIKRGKLYKQWIAHADLPAVEAPSTRTSWNILVNGEGNRRNLTLMHVLLGVCIGVAGTVLVFLLIGSL